MLQGQRRGRERARLLPARAYFAPVWHLLPARPNTPRHQVRATALRHVPARHVPQRVANAIGPEMLSTPSDTQFVRLRSPSRLGSQAVVSKNSISSSVGCPEPQGQRRLRIMKDGPRGQRDLMTTGGAFPAFSSHQRVAVTVLAARTDEPLRPAALSQVFLAGLFGGVFNLKLAGVAGKAGRRTPR